MYAGTVGKRAFAFASAKTLAVAASLIFSAAVAAATYDWSATPTNPPAGGAGTWDLASLDWLGPSGYVAWPNTGNDTAVFSGTAGTVTLGTDVQATEVEFETPGYILAGGHTLVLAATNPTLQVDSAATINSAVSCSSSLSISGGDQLTLGGNLTTSGVLSINVPVSLSGGSITAGALSGNGFLTLTDPAGGTALTIAGSASANLGAVVSGTGGIIKSGSGAQTISHYLNTFTGPTVINGGSIVVGDTGALQDSTVQINVNNGLDLSQLAPLGRGEVDLGNIAGSGNFNVPNNLQVYLNNNDNTIYSGQISGSGTFYKNGTGMLTLTGNNVMASFNSYAGGVNFQGGSLTLSGGMDSVAGNLTNGALVSANGPVSVKGYTVSDAGTKFHAQDFTVYSYNDQITTTVQNTAALVSDMSVTIGINSDDPTLLVQSGGTVSSITGSVNPNSSSATVTVIGTGSSWSMSSLEINGKQGIEAVEGISRVNISAGGLLSVSGTTTIYENASTLITIDGGILTTGLISSVPGFNSPVVVNFSNSPLADSTLNLTAALGTATFDGTIGGYGNIHKTGGSNQTLSGASTFFGDTTIDGGTVTLGNALALQGSRVVLNVNNGLLFGGLAAVTLGNLSGPGNLNLGATALTLGNGSSGSYSGVLSGSGSLTITGGTGLELTNSNNYSGGTYLNRGTLFVTSDAALGSGPVIFGGGTLLFENFTSNLSFNNAPQLQLAAATGAASTLAGNITGSSALTLVDDGELVLTGNNTYSGGTVINGGTLTIATVGALPAGGAVYNGATLQINANSTAGLITGPGNLNVSGSTLVTSGLSQNELNIGEGGVVRLQAPVPGVSSLSYLSIAPTGELDIGSQTLQIHYFGSASAPTAHPAVPSDTAELVRSFIAAAYDGGKWDGPGGINSGSTGPSISIGFADSADGVVSGLSSNTVQIQLARPGDANLDGVVGFKDLLILEQNYGNTNTIWDQGDFDYDGVVDFNDLKLLAANYGPPPTPSQMAQLDPAFASEVQQAFAAVPEPASGVLIAAGMLLLIGRRRW